MLFYSREMIKVSVLSATGKEEKRKRSKFADRMAVRDMINWAH